MFNDTCYLIQKSVISPSVKEYIESKEWKQFVFWDEILHKAANISLDLTIEKLGREVFQRQLDLFRRAQAALAETCSQQVVFPCNSAGERIPPERTDCIYGDNGCGFDCMDEFFRDWDGSGSVLSNGEAQ